MELVGGELADFEDLLEFGFEGGGGLRIGNEPADGLLVGEDLALAGDGLLVEANGLATGKDGGQQATGKSAEQKADAGPE
jgi:hypothetical protein